MVDRLPEFQGPKYAGSFRRGDFADFHQRFSLVPRRCAGKYPPAAREIRADSWAPFKCPATSDGWSVPQRLPDRLSAICHFE